LSWAQIGPKRRPQLFEYYSSIGFSPYLYSMGESKISARQKEKSALLTHWSHKHL